MLIETIHKFAILFICEDQENIFGYLFLNVEICNEEKSEKMLYRLQAVKYHTV
jgi:hypothetical protein